MTDEEVKALIQPVIGTTRSEGLNVHLQKKEVSLRRAHLELTASLTLRRKMAVRHHSTASFPRLPYLRDPALVSSALCSRAANQYRLLFDCPFGVNDCDLIV